MLVSFLSLLQDSRAAFAAVAAVLGLLIGSFLNVVIYRLPKMLARDWQAHCAALAGALPAAAEKPFNLIAPRSTCPACGAPIAAWQNIPLLSFIGLRGRCAHCRAPIGLRYPTVEALSGLLSGYIAWRFGFGAQAAWAMVFGWTLIALAFIDLDTQLLPDSMTQPLIWLGLLVNLFGVFAPLPAALIGAAGGYLSLWTVYWLFKLVTGKEGMGYGDFKLLAAIGAWLGWQLLPLTLLLSSLVGAAIGIVLIVWGRHRRETPIPFGPYLAGGGLIALLRGHDLSRLLMGF
ncbi:MAG TPA: prepilin peptidase [Betaproteobacteria bacterium]|nr:prepilin peptidase [Betaproteobacteria bacterium]